MDGADHQFSWAHNHLLTRDTASAGARTPVARLRLATRGVNLMESMIAIEVAYIRDDTGAGNQGVITCHRGDATTSRTGATCDSCTW